MAISLNDRITFTAQQPVNNNTENNDKRDAEKKVVTGGGAIAATTAAARAKAMKSGGDMYSSTARGIKGFTETTKTAANVAKKTKSLWAKVAENAKWAKNAILNAKYIRPIMKNKLVMGFAGALGYGFGFITLISGASDIVKVATETVEGKLGN